MTSPSRVVALALLPVATMLALSIDASAAPPATAASALARRAAKVTGDPYRAEEIRFTFVVTVGGKEKARRSHVYRPRAGTVSVTHGGKTVTLVKLTGADPSRAARKPEKHAAIWRKHAPGVPAKQAAKAWHAFVNDSFWLFAPAKLGDPGITLSSSSAAQLDVAYGDVGVTPGDRYRFHFDSSARVVRWSYTLGSGRKGEFRWLDHKRVGPLMLSMRRVSKDGKAVLSFEAVSVR